MTFTFNKMALNAFKDLPANTPLEFVHDDGVYLCAKHKGKIVFAHCEQFPQGSHMGGDDFVESLGTVAICQKERVVKLEVALIGEYMNITLHFE